MPRAVSLLTSAVLLLLPTTVLALAGNLDEPGIAARRGDDTTAIRAALKSDRHEFVGGMFLNSFTTMYFRGDARDVAMLVDDLSKIDGVDVHVRFSKAAGAARNLEGDLGECQFRVTHGPYGARKHNFGVTIFLGDGKVAIDELQLPPIRGERPVAADEKAGAED